jgi:hypothetical protein
LTALVNRRSNPGHHQYDGSSPASSNDLICLRTFLHYLPRPLEQLICQNTHATAQATAHMRMCPASTFMMLSPRTPKRVCYVLVVAARSARTLHSAHARTAPGRLQGWQVDASSHSTASSSATGGSAGATAHDLVPSVIDSSACMSWRLSLISGACGVCGSSARGSSSALFCLKTHNKLIAAAAALQHIGVDTMRQPTT